MGDLKEYLPILIPLGIVSVGLLIASLAHIFTHKKYRVGNRALWVIVSFINFIGPVLYFAIGKGDE
ncbi:MAG: PLDc N-terminal domain-containing protein [Clostridiales bacterium]|nr:PLDc N-terminal domain-containing protein [Clostridiales bacterium]